MLGQKSSRSLAITFVVAIAVVIVLLIVTLMLVLVLPLRGDPWSVAGFAATIAGIMAAMLAILGAIVVAFQWFRLDQRVEQVVAQKLDVIKTDLTKDLHKRIRAMGEFTLLWPAPLDVKEPEIERILEEVPDLPNAAVLMAAAHINVAVSWPPTREKSLARAGYWAQRALEASDSQDPGQPEYYMAQIRALQKEPESALHYLRLALQKGPSLHADLVSERPLFLSMTRGNDQRLLLDALLKLLKFTPPTPDAIRQHCLHRDDLQRSAFAVVRKSNGAHSHLTIQGVRLRSDNPTIEWSIVGEAEAGLALGATTLESLLKYLDDHFIVIELIPHESHSDMFPVTIPPRTSGFPGYQPS
ncbi:MAG: hypothetical protein OJF49_003250 [Ktedonobacterales bacterium]|jgi:hypothetical protein|nr:MAG: hypothetical protein OJF49_003250 [Ktedonobacterales bacterium]